MQAMWPCVLFAQPRQEPLYSLVTYRQLLRVLAFLL
uniref:Uncharacterized protein n=1 Tax=Arundo donax TaxID=35708 RepID=A0A0A8XYS1_ARUDO